MCGFVGILELDSRHHLHASRLREALKSLVRRGPDGEGVTTQAIGRWVAELGHRRLKIIDLDDRAAQPFRRGELIVLFNGELYNYIELRDELRALGAAFSTESDIEVVAAAFEQWGKDCFARFDGMFALAILDCRRRSAIFARDPFGEKPLYLAIGADQVAFASTVDSLLTLLGDSRRSINCDWIEAFLALGFAPAPMTVWEGVEKLAAGEIRELDLESCTWSSSEQSAQALIDEPQTREPFSAMEFETRLVKSIDRRLRADVPLALLLSGGIDSAYLATLVARQLRRPLVAITIQDRVESADEVHRAAATCTQLGIEHRVVEFPGRPLADLVDRSIPAMDEPIGDPAFPLLMELFSRVPTEFRVVLTGDGADELFLSYSNYRRLLEVREGMEALVARLLAGIAVRFAPSIGSAGYRLARRIVMHARLPIDTRWRMLAALSNSVARGSEPQWTHAVAPRDKEERVLWRYSLAHELPDYLLVKADRASMHHSFESRTPYLNRELFRYVLKCDPSTVDLGRKTHVTRRLNELLGVDLQFAKRGFFASGQDLLQRSADWHPLLLEPRFKARTCAATNPRLTDATTYYRLHVLNSWLTARYR